jgi:hypothetical protein
MDNALNSIDVNDRHFGVILVDHGSQRDESNVMLLEVVRDFADATGLSIVEPAHMELAEPSIATAFARCVERGATTVLVFPYFPVWLASSHGGGDAAADRALPRPHAGPGRRLRAVCWHGSMPATRGSIIAQLLLNRGGPVVDITYYDVFTVPRALCAASVCRVHLSPFRGKEIR